MKPEQADSYSVTVTANTTVTEPRNEKLPVHSLQHTRFLCSGLSDSTFSIEGAQESELLMHSSQG